MSVWELLEKNDVAGFFFLQNNLSGLIKVVSVSVRNIPYFCRLIFLYAGIQQLFWTHFPPLRVLLHFRGRYSFFVLCVSHPMAGCREPRCLPGCPGTEKMRAPLWLIPVPAMACPRFQGHVIVLMLTERQALSEEERRTETQCSYPRKLRT